MIKFVIEVCTETGATTTDKGSLLERLAADFLETQGFTIEENVRVTGIEIDLLAKDKSTGEVVYVECKAYRFNVAADAITKLIGNVTLRNVSSGWLLATHDFTKDAKGICDNWENEPPERRRLLRMYPPKKMIERLQQAGLICKVDTLQTISNAYVVGGEAYLLVTQRGRYWAVPLVDPTSGVTAAVAVHKAKDGLQVGDAPLLTWLSQLDSSLATLDGTVARLGVHR